MQVGLCKLMNPFMSSASVCNIHIATNASNAMECDALFDIGQAKAHTLRSTTTP